MAWVAQTEEDPEVDGSFEAFVKLAEMACSKDSSRAHKYASKSAFKFANEFWYVDAA